jgi:hypothetical protein
MKSKVLIAVVAATASFVALPLDAGAGGKKSRRGDERAMARDDCRPYNGPSGYEGNPWCDGGWKYAEDYPPGTSPYHDAFDLPQVRRLTRRWDR